MLDKEKRSAQPARAACWKDRLAAQFAQNYRESDIADDSAGFNNSVRRHGMRGYRSANPYEQQYLVVH